MFSLYSKVSHPIGRLLLVTFLVTVLNIAGTAETPPPHKSSELEVKQLAGSLHALGDIQFDVTARTIHFPATVNMTEGAIEFALVGTQGKIHEAVFATDIRPLHLRTVLSLLNFEPSPALVEGASDDDKAKAKPALVEIDVTWPDPAQPNGKAKKRVPLRECIVVMEFERISEFDEKVHLKPLPKGPWTYTGSRVDDAGFEAERELDFIAVQRRLSALFNLPHPNTDQDDLWQANPKALPAKETPVTIEITLPKK